MPGEKGMDDMTALMARFRSDPPTMLGGTRVVRVRDYLSRKTWAVGGDPEPLAAPRGDMVTFDLEQEGNSVAVRPSGTEPKIKFYMFACDPPAASQDLDAIKAQQAGRLQAMQRDLKEFAGV
jgi:phosphoglucomutase/phosphomannomutase